MISWLASWKELINSSPKNLRNVTNIELYCLVLCMLVGIAITLSFSLFNQIIFMSL